MPFFRSPSTNTIRSIAFLLVIVFTPLTSIQAAMLGTDTLIETLQHNIERDQIIERLHAQDAQSLLTMMGVDAHEIEDRVANMTPEELAQFNAKINELPAGGADIFGIVVLILLLMIVLDLFGAVDFFPAIKTIHY